MEQLLPCPFCGGTAYIKRPGTNRVSCVVGCRDCHCELESNEIGAGQAWNRRAVTPTPDVSGGQIIDWMWEWYNREQRGGVISLSAIKTMIEEVGRRLATTPTLDVAGLVARLRGTYTIPVQDGAGPLDGKDTFTRQFDVPPIQLEAANIIESLSRERAWQPIETAPKDGTWIVGRDNTVVYPCAFDQKAGLWASPADFHLVRGVQPTEWRKQ